jgi:hypothetical protein
VFLKNSGVAPAFRPIELDDERRAFLHAGLIDPVFVAVQRQQAAVRLQADGLQRVKHMIRRQRGIGMQFGVQLGVQFRG